MPMRIVRDNIIHIEADIIVNTANPSPIYTTGIDKAIYEAAGAEDLLNERKKIGEIARGDVAVTPAFGLNAKYIIHAVGPWWEGGNKGEIELLRSCYHKIFKETIERKCESIAIPVIASGANRFPKAEALQIALEVINRYLMEYEIDVILVVFDKKTFELSGKLFHDVQAYVDQYYVDDTRKLEYPQKDAAALEEMDEGPGYTGGSSDMSSDFNASGYSKDYQRGIGVRGRLTREKLLKLKEESFNDCLIRMMIERNLTSPDVYKPANLDRRMFSKMLNSKDLKPKKSSVIAIALALKLDINQASDFLGKAGYALTYNNDFDLVIRYCFENHVYDIIKDVNPILFDFNLPELGTIVRE